MAGIVRLNPKIANLKSSPIEYFESVVFEPANDGFRFAGNRNVMAKFKDHKAISETFSNGAIEYWSGGVMEQWSVGAMGYGVWSRELAKIWNNWFTRVKV
jgi:hypothetical protein